MSSDDAPHLFWLHRALPIRFREKDTGVLMGEIGFCCRPELQQYY